jgi:hypothetical protein
MEMSGRAGGARLSATSAATLTVVGIVLLTATMTAFSH